MPRKITIHGEERLRQRGITREDVESALNRPHRVKPGQLGSKWVYGYDTEGRILKVCISTNDENTVITAARPDSN
ncbi:DUF4258 domain-containing protein [Micromonospora aurantiaca (nom. illeg.)]|uniref:DUF4258 domain-containing protein n=1 Tax=Micromonospora aurantiaca (nom. illeg.) TaxID=47850 RepID=UPI003787D33F